MDRERASRLAVAFAVGALIIVGCTTDTASGPTTVAVTLQEWAVLAEPGSAPTGDITFDVTNDGPEDIHEFVVIRTDLDAGDLPVDADGVVDEAGGGMEVIDEIEDIPVGESASLTVSLDAGAYVLICNIWDADEGEAHYTLGMRTPFTVTE